MSSKFSSLLIRLLRILDSLKQEKKTMHYHELAQKLGGHSPRSKYIAMALGLVVESDQEAGEPLRSSLITRTDTNMPGDGYWWKLQEEGIIKDRDNVEERESFWKKQMALLGVVPQT